MLQAERHKIICTHVQQQGSSLVTELIGSVPGIAGDDSP